MADVLIPSPFYPEHLQRVTCGVERGCLSNCCKKEQPPLVTFPAVRFVIFRTALTTDNPIIL